MKHTTFMLLLFPLNTLLDLLKIFHKMFITNVL